MKCQIERKTKLCYPQEDAVPNSPGREKMCTGVLLEPLLRPEVGVPGDRDKKKEKKASIKN